MKISYGRKIFNINRIFHIWWKKCLIYRKYLIKENILPWITCCMGLLLPSSKSWYIISRALASPETAQGNPETKNMKCCAHATLWFGPHQLLQCWNEYYSSIYLIFELGFYGIKIKTINGIYIHRRLLDIFLPGLNIILSQWIKGRLNQISPSTSILNSNKHFLF